MGRPIKYEIGETILKRLYQEEQLSITEISQQLGIPFTSIHTYMKRLDIPIRSLSEAFRIARKRGRMQGIPVELTAKELKKAYWEDGLSFEEIGYPIGCSASSVRKAFIKYGIPWRDRSEALHNAFKYHKGNRDGKFIDKRYGYVYILKPAHPRARKDGYVSEHILIWEEANGKPLPVDWIVHHLNGIRNDNRPLNLMGMPKGNHHYALRIQAIQKRIRELEANLRQISSQAKLSY